MRMTTTKQTYVSNENDPLHNATCIWVERANQGPLKVRAGRDDRTPAFDADEIAYLRNHFFRKDQRVRTIVTNHEVLLEG